jgi:hypothetical protein
MAITVERLQAEVDVDPSKAIAGLEAFDLAVSKAAKDKTANLDVDTGEADTQLALFDVAIDAATHDRTVHINVDKDQGFAEVTGAIGSLENLVHQGETALGGLESGLSGVAKEAEQAGSSLGGGGGGFSGGVRAASSSAGGFGDVLSKVGGSLGSLVMPALIFTLVTVLPGAFAAAAGGAAILLGALVPLLGLLGAIPVALGGLVVVAGTLMAVFGPVIKGLTAYGQATKAAGTSSDDLAARQHSLVMANQAVAASAHSVQQAEQALSDARKNMKAAPAQAEEALRQAHFDAAQAVLNEKQAVLALVDAQKNLRDAQSATADASVSLTKQTDFFTGKQYEVAIASKAAVSNAENERRARLSVQQAELSLQEARDASSQAQDHLAEEEKKGIKNSDIMVAARRRLADAEYALKQARQASANAAYNQRQAEKALTEGAAGGTAATNAWDTAQKSLTSTGIEFVKFVHDDFMPMLTDISKAGQNALLPGIEDGLKSAMTLLPIFKREIGDLGSELGTGFADFMDFWTQPTQRHTIVDLFGDLNRVVGAGLRVLNPFSRIIADVIDDATPMVVHLLQGVENGLDGVANWLESDLGKQRALNFFHDAAKFTGLWLDVLKPIGGIFMGITRAVEPLSTRFLKSTAGWLDKISQDVNSKKGQKNIFSYVTDQLPALKVIGQIVGSIVDALFTSSKGGTDSSFYKFLVAIRDDVLPPIEKMFENFDASTFAADLATNFGDLITLLNGVDWARVGKDIHDISGDIHGLAVFLDKTKAFSNLVMTLTTPLPILDYKHLFDLFGNKTMDQIRSVGNGIADVGSAFGIAIDKGNDFNDWTKREMGKLPGWIDDHVTGPVGGFFSDLWGSMKQIAKDGWDNTKDWFKDLPGWIHDHVVQPIEDAFDTFFTKWLPEHFKQAIKDLPKAAGTSLLDLVPHPSLPNPLDLIRHHWSGGPVTKDEPYLVGEQGPELFIPSAGGRIAPSSPTKEMMTSTKQGIDPQMIEDLLRRVLDQAKPDVKIDQTFNERIDPKHVAAELAWELAGV